MIRHPAETSFYEPTPREQDEPLLGFGQFHDFQAHSLCLGSIGGLFSSVGLIHKGNFHQFSSDGLNLLSQRSTCARSCSFAAVTTSASRCPKVSTARGTLLPFLRLPLSSPARFPLSILDCKVRLSNITALGWAFRPSSSLSNSLKSWTIASNTPALIHRCVG